ncbi:MAG: fumarylacetoacetate hydrolase family protein [Pseudobdellovibrio sp.]
MSSNQITQNIWAVGRNYKAHAKEMNAPIPKSPLFFLKSGGCLNSEPMIQLPPWSNDIHHEIELAFKVDKNLNFSAVTLALDLTARDHQESAKKLGQPWTLAKSFKNACPIGAWIPIAEFKNLDLIKFDLSINNSIAQQGLAEDMVFKPAALLEFVKKHFNLLPNDIILTGTPEGVGPIHSGDILDAKLHSENRTLLTCHWDAI